MVLFATVLIIVLSSYVGATPNIKDDSKTGYFVAAGIIYALLIVGSIFLGGAQE